MRKSSASISLRGGAAIALAMVFACSSKSDGPAARAPAVLPPLSSAVALTDTVTLVLQHPISASIEQLSPDDPTQLQQLIDQGFGNFTPGPGEAVRDRMPDGSLPPAPGPNRHRVLRFAHLCDFQTADDESPARLARFDGPPPFESAARPQEGLECRVVNAVIRTVNRVNQDDKMDFVLLGGDNADSAQSNELDWMLSLFGGNDGKAMACDSGDPDDPVAGANNDGKDPFVPQGLDVPWYWVTGNHDVLVQGNFPTDGYHNAQAIGTTATGGTRNYRLPGAPITEDDVIADPKRTLLQRQDMISKVIASTGKSGPAGHGLGTYAQQTGKAFYTADFPNSPIRLLVIDVSAETGGSEGVLHRSDLDGFVKPALAQAQTDGKLVVIASHHPSGNFSDGSGAGGTKQDDAVLGPEWQQLLAANPQVIAHFAGHTHQHQINFIASTAGGDAGTSNAGYWEVQTSAIADYPHQFRVIEIWDEDNGMMSIRTIAGDWSTEGDPVAAQGKTLGMIDFDAAWVTGPKAGTLNDRNVALWAKKP
jgi:3',5'-cyclic AMP phosphodiesterase CpdA